MDEVLQIASLNAWSITIRLLEDDDDSVRNEVLHHLPVDKTSPS